MKSVAFFYTHHICQLEVVVLGHLIVNCLIVIVSPCVRFYSDGNREVVYDVDHDHVKPCDNQRRPHHRYQHRSVVNYCINVNTLITQATPSWQISASLPEQKCRI